MGKTVVVFTHGGTINVTKTRFIPKFKPKKHDPKNTETYKFIIQRREVSDFEGGCWKRERILSLKRDPESKSPFVRDVHEPLDPNFQPHPLCPRTPLCQKTRDLPHPWLSSQTRKTSSVAAPNGAAQSTTFELPVIKDDHF